MNIASGSLKVGRSQCLLSRLSHQSLQLRPIPAGTLHKSWKIKADGEPKKEGDETDSAWCYADGGSKYIKQSILMSVGFIFPLSIRKAEPDKADGCPYV